MEHIKIARKQLKLSQFALANLSGVGRYRISLLEMGYLRATDDELQRLEQALKSAKRRKRGAK